MRGIDLKFISYALSVAIGLIPHDHSFPTAIFFVLGSLTTMAALKKLEVRPESRMPSWCWRIFPGIRGLANGEPFIIVCDIVCKQKTGLFMTFFVNTRGSRFLWDLDLM